MYSKLIKIIFTIVFLNLTVSLTYAQSLTINSNEAISHINEEIFVCGKVVQVTKLKKRTVLNINKAYPNEDLSLIVWDDRLIDFENEFGKLSSLQDKNVCAFGKIRTYNQRLQITLNNTSHLNIK